MSNLDAKLIIFYLFPRYSINIVRDLGCAKAHSFIRLNLLMDQKWPTPKVALIAKLLIFKYFLFKNKMDLFFLNNYNSTISYAKILELRYFLKFEVGPFLGQG